MTILASTILDTVYKTLQDTRRVTWLEPEVLAYLNEALRATAFAKPDMYVLQDFVSLDPGPTQFLPDGGIALMDIVRNQTGRVVTQVDKSLLEEANRFWPRATQQAEVEHFTTDARNPLRFQVFPPNDGTGFVELVYGALPPVLLGTTSELAIPDSYEDPLVSFTLHRCYAKNTKDQDLTKSSYYRQAWGSALGLKSQGQVAVAPRVSQSPGA